MSASILALGFVVGMQHAFEADHLAAVSTLVARRAGLREMGRQGAIWGVGHTLALLAMVAVVAFSPWTLPDGFGPNLETVVGVVLVLLGVRLLYRLWRDRVHVHVHRHEDGEVHLHAHSHRDDEAPHATSDHDHAHGDRTTLLVGLLHGAAGSAALVVVVAAGFDSPLTGLTYVLLFGLGSILGMATLGAALAVPLAATARRLTWANRAIRVAVGLLSIAVGVQRL